MISFANKISLIKRNLSNGETGSLSHTYMHKKKKKIFGGARIGNID